MQRLLFIVGLSCLALLTTLLPANAADLIAQANWSVYGGAITLTRETVADLPGGNGSVIRLNVTKPSDPFYTTGITTPVPAAIPADTRLQLRFLARSETFNPLRAVVEKNGPPYTNVAEISPVLTRDWKTYTVTGTAAEYPENGLAVRFQVGHQAGIVEVADIHLDSLGTDPALQAAKAAVQPEAMAARIRRVRMGDLQIRVLDHAGRAVADAEVKVTQTRHAFLFGCNIFNLQPESDDAWQKAYQEKFTALFNYATLPFYWGAFEPRPGKTDDARLEAMARWCNTHGATPKGHPLVWHEVYPDWAPSNPDEAIPLLHRRVTETIAHYRSLISYWDVLNEANAAAGFRNGEGAWIKRDGPVGVVQTALGWAREAGQGTETLLYNDFDTGESNVALLTGLQDRKALPDAVGIQSHMHGGVWPLERVWAIADRFGQFGKPVHFTEVTVLSGPRRDNVDMSHPPDDWVTTREEERAQADYLERFYTVLFSHPGVRAITYWDFSDRNAWQNAPAGLVRKDMSSKPAYDRLLKLIKQTWWTTAQGRSDSSGAYAVRAFYGDYTLTATDAHGTTVTQTLSFPMGAGAQTVTLRLP